MARATCLSSFLLRRCLLFAKVTLGLRGDTDPTAPAVSPHHLVAGHVCEYNGMVTGEDTQITHYISHQLAMLLAVTAIIRQELKEAWEFFLGGPREFYLIADVQLIICLLFNDFLSVDDHILMDVWQEMLQFMCYLLKVARSKFALCMEGALDMFDKCHYVTDCCGNITLLPQVQWPRPQLVHLKDEFHVGRHRLGRKTTGCGLPTAWHFFLSLAAAFALSRNFR